MGVGRRRQKQLCAYRSGVSDREEYKMTCRLGVVEPAEMLGGGTGSANYSLWSKPTQVPVHST